MNEQRANNVVDRRKQNGMEAAGWDFEVGEPAVIDDMIKVFQTDFHDKRGEMKAALCHETYHSADRKEPFDYGHAFTAAVRCCDTAELACAGEPCNYAHQRY